MEIANIGYIAVILILSSVLAAILTLTVFLISSKTARKDKERDITELEIFIKNFQENTGDFIKSYEYYVSQLNGYFITNKRLASKSLRLSVFISFLGFILIISGIISANYVIETNLVVIFAAVSGMSMELFAALLYKGYLKTVKEMNFFTDRLRNSLKVCSALKLAQNLPADKRENFYFYIFQNIISN